MANRSFSGRCSFLFSTLTFLTILFCFIAPLTHGAELEDLGAYLRVTTANESSSLNSLTRMITSSADVTLTNISEKTFTVPLHAVINISVAGVQMPEALGGVDIAPYGKYYYDLSGQFPGGLLPPGGSVTFRAVFVRYYTVRFTYTVSPYGLPASSTAPQIQISPTNVDFGEVAIGASAVQELTVSNPGDAALSVTSIQGIGSPFTLYPPTSFDLAPGGSQQVRVGFSPETEDSFTGSIGIASNAPGQEQTTVSVSGRGIAPVGQPAISAPTTVEFGAVMEGQSATKDVTVCSTGTAPLSITQATLDHSEFSWAPNGNPSLPLSLAGGECTNLRIAFIPETNSGGSTREGNLTIASDAGNSGVSLSGSAVTPVALQTLSALDARVINGAVYDQIDETTCSAVEGEVRFGEGSRSSDSFVVTLTDQTGALVSSSAFAATQGAGTAIFSGIDACELKDGIVAVTVSLGDDDQNTMTGTPAAKNTSELAAPILDPIDPATVFSTIKICGEAPANTLVQINGGSGTVDLQLTNGQTRFCLDVPLRPNTENLLVASATDQVRGLVASAAPVKVNQVDPSSVAIAQASSRPLTVEEVEILVEKGVIDLNDPANFNVSMFTIGLNIGGSSFIISQPVVVNSTPGTVSYSVGPGWSGSGYPTTFTTGSAMQVVVIRTPSGQTIPGVIIIDGRIRTLKEFFQVTIAIQNTTTLFDLTDMVASIALPAGLSPVKAGPGTDVSSINTGSATDKVDIGTIGPQQTGTGQFIIRGDGIGTHNVTVNFQGFLSGGGLANPYPISGSANTSVQVFGPPKLDVVVRHPGDPNSSEPDVTAGEIYTLTVDVTNRSPTPALYASLQLLIGQGAVLVDGDGNEVVGSSTVRNLGHIQPGQTASQAFRVKSKLTGKILACQALASENINLTVDIGGGDCSIANTIPVNFQFPPANAPPAVMAINPLNNQPNLPLSTTIMATLTPQAGCLTTDTWTNVVTDWVDPNDHDKGVRIVSAELATIGTFYLEELDRFGNPVAHVPVDLTVTTGVDGQTSIAVLRPGLASPLGQSLLKPNTFYRATLVGGDDGICNAGLNSVTLANSFRWTFSTEQTCVGVDAPTATLDQPLNGSTGQPLNQKIVLNFSRRMNPASFTFDPATSANSSFLVVAGGTVSGGDVSGGAIVPGSATFSNLFQTLTFTPSGNLPEGKTIYVRLKNTIKDVCDNPLQTPDGGILLFGFTTSPPDTTPPDPPAVNPLPALTNQSVIQVSGSAEPGSVVSITGGATTATVTTSSSGLFSTSVRLVPDTGNTLQATAKDSSNNLSAAIDVDKNGAALTVVHDSVPPTVVSIEPANGATNVANNAAIHVTFSKAINPGTVNSLNFKVEGTTPVIGSFTLVGDNGFTFIPTAPLESGQTFIVRLRAGGIADTAGNSLTSEYTSLFVIEEGDAPTLSKIAPSSGTPGTTFDVTFTGTNLATAGAVVSDNPGVISTIVSKSDTSVVASVTIAAEAAIGDTNLGLATVGGTVKISFTIIPMLPSDPFSFHTGAEDPAIEGFNPVSYGGSSTINALASDLGHLAWSISGLSLASQFGYYTGALSSVQKTAFANQGFILTLDARVIKGLAPSYDTTNYTVIGGACLETESRRFEIALGLDVNGDTVVILPTAIDSGGPGSSVRASGPRFTLIGSGSSYHIYQLVFNPSTQLADLYVDGVRRIQNYAGHTSYVYDRGLVFGTWSGGQTNFAYVDAKIGSQNLPSPAVSQISQTSAIQGSTFDVTFTGTNLATVNGVVSDNPGVTGSIISRSDTSVTAMVTIAPQAATGATALGLSTLGGVEKLPFTVTTAGTISLANFQVGKDMQINPVVIFTPAPAAGTVVSITSSDAAKLLLSTSPTVAGSGSLSYTMAGGAAIGDLQAQALAGSGAAAVTVSAPGYASATATATLRPSGFVITNPDFNTVVGDADTTVTVAARMLNEALASTAAGQVRGGFSVNVSVTSSDPAVGTIVVNPVTLAGGSSTAATSFHPVAGGSTVISLATPEGFGTPTSGQGIAATVVGKVITLTVPTTNLVTRNSYPFTIGLAAPAGPGGQPVELAVSTSDLVTIPATVTVPEGDTSVKFNVETGLATGTLTLTASAPGFTGDSKALTVAARTFSLYSPLVGIDRTVAARITLDQPAPSDGATFALSVANPGVAIVSPAGITIPAGETVGDFQLTGGLTVGLTTLTADGTGSGYISKTLNITATNRLIDVPSGKEVELGTSHVVPVLIAPDPAPAGGVTLAVTSSDPTIVEVLTPTIVIPEGSYQGTIEIRAASGTTGTAVITAANAGFAPDTMQVSLTAGLDILESFANFGATATGDLYLRLISGGQTYRATAGGVGIDLSSSDLACVATPSSLNIAEGTAFASVTLSYGGTAPLPCSATVTASNSLFGTDTAQVTINQAQDLGGMTISQLENSSNLIGAGLQSPYRLTLATGNHGGVKVQLKSSDPAVARLSASATNFGLPLIELAIPDGQTSVTFYVQGVRETTGSVTLTAQSPRFNTKTASLAVVQPVFLLTDLTSPTTTLAADDAFYVHTGVLNATGTGFSQYQNVSAQGPLPVTFISSNSAVGQMAKAYERGASVTVNIPVNQHNSPTTLATGGVAFDPITGGTTTVAATAPGFDSAWSGASKAITVNQPVMTIPDATGIGHRVGASLQVQYRVDLGTSTTNHGGVTVHVESSDSGKVRLSNSATMAGSAAIDVPIADGERYGYFYVQGVRGVTGTADLTATHALFATVTATINVVQPIMEIIGLNASTTPLAADDDFYVYLRVLNAAGTVSYTQNVSGEGPLLVTFTSSDPAVGQLAKTGERGASITINIPVNQSYSPITVASGGVAFDALSGGTTTVAVTAPGFNTAWSDAAKVVTVNAPAMTIPDATGIGHRVGASLQVQYSIDLGGTNHGGVTVHVESGDSGKVRLSNSATTAGTAAINVPIADGQRYGYFYVQGVRGTTGTATLTATQSLFATATATINVVQPIMQINGINTSTTPLAADDNAFVYLYIYNAAGTNYYLQNVSGEGPLPVTFTSSDPAVGQLAKTGERGASVTINIPVDQYNSPTTVATGGVAFDALAGGTTTVAATAPGFNNAYWQASKVVTVNPSALTIADTTGIGNRVGASLQVQYSIDLGGTNHGGVTVQVESGDSGKVRLSNSATTAGTAAIDVPIADGQRYGYFYVQGVRSTTGTAILNATHPLFATATATITVVQPVMYISSLNTSTNPLAADDDFYVYLRVLNAAGTSVYSQNVSGEGPLPVTFTSSDPIVGLLAKTGERGASVTVNIPVNQDSTPTTLASGGVAYDALSSGITTVAATAPGFNNAYSQASQAVTVKPLAITITDVDNDTFRVGGGLQTRYRVTLNTSTHGGVTVRVASGDTTRVLLAPDATTPGTSFIDLFIANGQTTKDFYVRGVAGATGTVTLTATSPLFTTGSEAVEVVRTAVRIADVETVTYRVGGGLQNRYRLTLEDPAYGGVTVRVASSDTSRALLAPDAVTSGTSFVDLVFADGQTTKDFHVQGINGVTGMITITATSPIFNSGTAAVEVVRSAIRIEGLNTSMTASAANDPFYVSSGILDAVGISFAKTQTVSPAGPLQVLLTSGTPSVGQLLTNVAGGAQVTVSVPANSSASPGTKATGGVEFDPLTGGSTTVSATVNGFNNDWSGARTGITVTP